MSGKQDTEGGLASFGVGVPAGSKQVRVGLIVVSRSMFGIVDAAQMWERQGKRCVSRSWGSVDIGHSWATSVNEVEVKTKEDHEDLLKRRVGARASE